MFHEGFAINKTVQANCEKTVVGHGPKIFFIIIIIIIRSYYWNNSIVNVGIHIKYKNRILEIKCNVNIDNNNNNK
jgi:hypothetical protein